jgi:hypothetical protein
MGARDCSARSDWAVDIGLRIAALVVLVLIASRLYPTVAP